MEALTKVLVSEGISMELLKAEALGLVEVLVIIIIIHVPDRDSIKT